MALGSTSSSGSVPTATGRPSANTPDGAPDFFASGTSPPIIIGFIAIGTFAVGIVALCAWRRVTGRNLVPLAVTRDRYESGEKASFGEKPRLFEIWSQAFVSADVAWEQIMPVSTSVMIERSMVAEDAQASKFIWPKKHAEYVEKSAEIQALQSPRRHLQVAVVLAMPSPLHMKAGPRDALHVRRSDDDPHEFERTLEYAIGLVNVPWSSGDVGREASISGRSTSKLVISDPSTLVDRFAKGPSRTQYNLQRIQTFVDYSVRPRCVFCELHSPTKT